MRKYVAYHTAEQDEKDKIDEIQKFCKVNAIDLYQEKIFDDLMEVKELLNKGDVVIMAELNQLGKTRLSIWKEIKELVNGCIRIMILEIPSTVCPLQPQAKTVQKTNQMLLEVCAAFAKKEIQRANNTKDVAGRPKTIDLADFRNQYRRVINGEIPPFQLAREMNMKIPTFYKYRGLMKKELTAEMKEKLTVSKSKRKGADKDMDKIEKEIRKEEVENALYVSGLGSSADTSDYCKELLKKYVDGEIEMEEVTERLISYYKEKK